MEETKAQAWRRLEKEGNWDNFRSKRKELRLEKKLGREESYFAALEFFPPEDQAEFSEGAEQTVPSDDGDDSEASEDDEDGSQGPLEETPDEYNELDDEDLEELIEAPVGSSDFLSDFQWAYDNIANLNAKPEDAPSGGAWFLLNYGRSAKAKFCELAIRVFTKTGKEVAEEKIVEDDKRKQFGVINKLLEYHSG